MWWTGHLKTLKRNIKKRLVILKIRKIAKHFKLEYHKQDLEVIAEEVIQSLNALKSEHGYYYFSYSISGQQCTKQELNSLIVQATRLATLSTTLPLFVPQQDDVLFLTPVQRCLADFYLAANATAIVFAVGKGKLVSLGGTMECMVHRAFSKHPKVFVLLDNNKGTESNFVQVIATHINKTERK